ncbi:ferric-chelate reductase [Aspergillus avenaceus]|uniref:ferric-chelate reductase (NADPH) n=1 Tax=Aspergillus avenaceus TaxID=36643 RepID=A0A5N6TSK7_ASPAV|nr:ferric-chelate reductase [Aspergillus avenaceus]
MAFDKWYDMLNDELCYATLWIMACMIVIIFAWQTSLQLSSHLRRLATFTDHSQQYHRIPDSRMVWLKQHLLYAPLLRTRHNEEWQLSRAINMGTLPSRLHTFLLTLFVVMNVALCTTTLPYASEESTVAGLIRNRTGYMATVNLFPLLVMAGRNNPLIPLLRVSFDTWNLIHRWLGRIVVLEALAHVIAWLVPKVQQHGWSTAFRVLGKPFMFNGLMCMLAMLVILVQSPSPIRHAFYETFLHLHIALACIAIGFIWHHVYRYSCRYYLYAAVAFWACERLTRLLILVYRNYSAGHHTTATLEPLPGDAVRVTLSLARPWTFSPGQYLFLYIPSISGWTSHPFSVAWSETTTLNPNLLEKGLEPTTQPTEKATSISLLIRRRTGFTDRLYKAALSNPGSVSALVEGPYGNLHSLDSYGTLLLFAGGVGITHCLPFIRHLIQGFNEGTVAARRVTLVWIIQSPEHLEWIRPWMTSILGMEGRRELLQIKLFVTRPRNPRDVQSPSATVQMFSGRPDTRTLVEGEAWTQVGAMGVVVCGGGALSDDVRKCCRGVRGSTVYYIEEAFSW